MTTGNRKAEESLRSAIDHLVEAFLEARHENQGLFTLAHRIGRIVEVEFGCALEYNEKEDTYNHRCPIRGLHSSMGMSIAWFQPTRCSICAAPDFECDHIPGDRYQGVECRRISDGPVIDHVALTANPDFAYTFHIVVPTPRAEIEQDLGKLNPGQPVYSDHCRDCPGADLGPTPADLNPEQEFRRLVIERAPR